MVFFAESITTFYDKEQDRLALIFDDKNKKRLMGLMTRQLFKNLLAQLPNWLTQQHRDSMPSTTGMQREISYIHHQISQQKVAVTYEKIQSNHQLEFFLINAIHFTKADLGDNDQKIRLKFLDPSKATAIIFVLNSAQLHKLIGEIFKQVPNWDIDNPWREKNITPASSNTKNKIVH